MNGLLGAPAGCRKPERAKHVIGQTEDRAPPPVHSACVIARRERSLLPELFPVKPAERMF